MWRALLKLWLCAVVLRMPVDAGRRIIRKTKYGRIRGIKTDLAQVFYGIPYAQPAQRWTAPAEVRPWRGTLHARIPRPMCYQDGNCDGPPIDCVPQKSEDCLFLNIFAPLFSTKKARKAVLFFIHGGSLDSESGAGLVYNAEMLANKGDIIVVTFNYRIGAFGFLVTGNSSGDITGNYGLMDQRLALKWVHDNIHRFGGDKSKITMSGQSAGAYSVGIHLTSGNVDGLFRQAILQSTVFTIPLKPMDIAIQQGHSVAEQSGCLSDGSANVTCLRALPADAIVEIQRSWAYFTDRVIRNFMPWLPHIDGIEVKSGFIEGLLKTSIPPKPMMVGTVTDEGMIYIHNQFNYPVPESHAPSIIQQFVPNTPADILDLYPVSDTTDVREEMAVMTTDYVLACPEILISRLQSKRMPIYRYTLTQPLNFPAYLRNEPYCLSRVCHGTDLPFVFQSARRELFLFDQANVALSDKIISYWASFVKHGDPNRDIGDDGTQWLEFRTSEPGAESTIVFSSNPERLEHIQGYKDQFCDVWDLSGYQ